MARYRYHPACLLFPMLGREELQELADNIKAKGLLHDIVLCWSRLNRGPVSGDQAARARVV